MFDKKEIKNVILKYGLTILIVIVVASISTIIIGREVNKISMSISGKKKAEAILQKRSVAAAVLRIDLGKIAPYESEINGMIPPTENILQFTAALENLAKIHSLQQTLSFGNPSEPVQNGTTSFVPVNYTIALTASADQFHEYLKDFENLPYLTSVYAIDISAPNDWKNSGGATMRATIYTQTAK